MALIENIENFDIGLAKAIEAFGELDRISQILIVLPFSLFGINFFFIKKHKEENKNALEKNTEYLEKIYNFLRKGKKNNQKTCK